MARAWRTVRPAAPSGRPRHPEPLTPAEQRVLAGVWRGLSNPEIASEIALSPETVKYHVANMLSKLALEDRKRLAAWEPEVEMVAMPSRLGGFIALFLEKLVRLPTLAGRAGTPLLLTSIGVVAGLATLAVLRAKAFDDEPPPSPPPVSTPSPAATPVPAVVKVLRLEPPARLTMGLETNREHPQQLVYDLLLALYDAALDMWRLSDAPAPGIGAWSPDGRWFAYITDRDERHMLLDLQTSTRIELGAPG